MYILALNQYHQNQQKVNFTRQIPIWGAAEFHEQDTQSKCLGDAITPWVFVPVNQNIWIQKGNQKGRNLGPERRIVHILAGFEQNSEPEIHCSNWSWCCQKASNSTIGISSWVFWSNGNASIDKLSRFNQRIRGQWRSRSRAQNQ